MQNIYGLHHSAKSKTCTINTIWNNQLPHLTKLAIFLIYSLLSVSSLWDLNGGAIATVKTSGRIMQRWRGEAVKCLVRSQKMAARWSEKMVWQNGLTKSWQDGLTWWWRAMAWVPTGRHFLLSCASVAQSQASARACDLICAYWRKHQHQGGRSCMNLRMAFAEKFGLRRKF